MIILPVERKSDGKTVLMMFVTDDTIRRLQAGQACELFSDALERLTGVSGVELRPARDDAHAAERLKKIMPDANFSFEIVMVDRTTKGDPR